MLSYRVVLLLIFSRPMCLSARKNVCKSLRDYRTIDTNRNCWYNPDVGATPKEIATRYGYHFENHDVISDDLYVTTLFRISTTKNIKNPEKRKFPVILHHGFMADSLIFMAAGRKSLAFFLANEGYDVWLPNSRGSNYSPKHLKYTIDDPEYWDFGIHDMAEYDLPDIIDYVYGINNEKITFIGYSMGATVSYIYASLYPQHAKENLRAILSLGPLAYEVHSGSTFAKTVSRHRHQIWDGFTSMGIFGTNSFVNRTIHTLQKQCQKWPFIAFCAQAIDAICGVHEKSEISRVYPIFFSHYPSGFSMQTLMHLVQFFDKTNSFNYYSYGRQLNRKIYKNDIPPEYPLWRINVPVHLFYGENDLFANEKDVRLLFERFRTRKTITRVPNFAHMNFAAGFNMTSVYQMIINSANV